MQAAGECDALFGGFEVTNIFALRFSLTDPLALRKCDDPIGTENDAAIIEVAKACHMVIAAWGTHGGLLDRGDAVVRLLDENRIALWCLGKTRGNHPLHPLYIPYTQQPELY